MHSLFDELTEKLAKDPRRTKKGGARFDLSLLLFNAREAVRDLWVAADAVCTTAEQQGQPPPETLASAVARLRPIFGHRPPRP